MRLICRTLLALALSGLVAGPVRAADDPAVRRVEDLYASFDNALKSGAKDASLAKSLAAHGESAISTR